MRKIFLIMLIALSAIILSGCNSASMMVRDGNRALAVSGNNCCGTYGQSYRRPMQVRRGRQSVPRWVAIGRSVTPNYRAYSSAHRGSRVTKRTVITKRTIIVNRRTGEVVHEGEPRIISR